jgi:hypothetical protein
MNEIFAAIPQDQALLDKAIRDQDDLMHTFKRGKPSQ